MTLYVGIDWGSTDNHVCVVDNQGEVKDRFVFELTREGIEKLLGRVDCHGKLQQSVFVLERPEGLLVEQLLGRELEVWHLNPKQMDRFRDRFSVAGAKDDARDSYVLACCARTDSRLFRRVRCIPAGFQLLRVKSRLHTRAVADVVRHQHRGRAALADYYPSFLTVSKDLQYDWVRALWRLAPTPEAARKLKPARVRDLLRKARVQRDAEEVVALLRADSLVASPALVEASRAEVALAIDMLDVAVRHERRIERELEGILDELEATTEPARAPEAEGAAPPQESHEEPNRVAITTTAVRSMPGVGCKIAAVLLGEAWEGLLEGSYPDVRLLSGVAPVTSVTGVTRKRKRKQRLPVVMRRACNEHLRDIMHLWGSSAARTERWGEYRRTLLARGHTVARANRQVADRLLEVLCAVIRHGTTYDASRWPVRDAA
jgi:endonuclease III